MLDLRGRGLEESAVLLRSVVCALFLVADLSQADLILLSRGVEEFCSYGAGSASEDGSRN